MTANYLQSCYQSERKCLCEYMYAFILFIFSDNKCVYMNIHLFFSHPTCFFSPVGTVFLVISLLQSLEFSNSAMSNLYPYITEAIRLWLCLLNPMNLLRKVAWFLGNTHTYGSRLWANGSEWNKCNTIHRHLCIKQ